MGQDKRWMEEHVLKGEDLLLYGRLLEEMDELPPEVIWKELRAAAEAYLGGGKDRTRLVHQRVDELIDALVARDHRFGYPSPFCHRGCANCCHELVYCTDEEALRIHEHCAEEGIAIDYAKLARQLEHVETDGHLDHTGGTTWNDQEEADQSCIFLGPDRACRIWLERPLVCRVHLAEQTDRHCRPHNGVENPEALGISYIELSYILSAVFMVHRDSVKKTLGRLLLGKN
ncbi:YkgJ family cysteine cluster protein [Holophaga foetida]|uniref:YkgJ family cysteine cluster protein n=1 Tax=Holophaga foetida TaxID=35839 RepID=UPI0002474314|nr:YkgJ family cysteine cluster protein [Holophaga foetida]